MLACSVRTCDEYHVIPESTHGRVINVKEDAGLSCVQSASGKKKCCAAFEGRGHVLKQ